MGENGEDTQFLRERARQYRERAARESDRDRAALFLELAEALEREAKAIKKDYDRDD